MYFFIEKYTVNFGIFLNYLSITDKTYNQT